MRLSILASSSDGNAALVWDEEVTVLVDAGISKRRLLTLKRKVGCEHHVDMILVSHSHADHCEHARKLSEYWQCPTLCSLDTRKAIMDAEWGPFYMEPGKRYQVDRREECFTVEGVPVQHINGSFGFVIRKGEKAVGIFNDLGALVGVRDVIADLHVLAIDCNYSVAMLMESKYDDSLKKRLMAGYGHLSNDQVRDLLRDHPHPKLHTIVPLHLSKHNNLPMLAEQAIRAGDPRVCVVMGETPFTMEI